ncbi:Phenolic glucoside malonyltransferase 2 [Platanthera zijinensis]|uniref:Phenolic glucoside malonyltransferase 2 n=1 Tax=Platanthera zijinensis TaxID=2320716 RepID=A0AAP0G466_9ASPA
MKTSPSVNILHQTRISPSASAADGKPRQPLPLIHFDLLWLNYGPVERIFFYNYPHPTSHFLHSHLPAFKSSLSIALSTFYPIAATVRRRSDGHFEISPSDTDSVSLTVSEYVGDAADFLEISGDHARPIEKLVPLVPFLPRSRDAQPLLAIQVTLFPNHGLSVALTVHHTACDGFSSMQFVKLWATLAFRPESVAQLPTPVMDRSVIPDTRNLTDQMEKAVCDEKAEEKNVKARISSAVYGETFTLSAPEIGRFKKLVMGRAAEKGIPRFHCSSFVISCAYSWICLLKTCCITDGDGAAHLAFAVDWRRRIQPRIPENYYGNCLSGCFVKAKADELLGSDGIVVACAAIGKAIEEMGDDVQESLDRLVERLGEVAPWRPLSLSGSPKLGVYGIEFGWGKPIKVEVISTRETGAMAVAESRAGDGGIEFGVILPEDELKTFAHHFAAGMDW